MTKTLTLRLSEKESKMVAVLIDAIPKVNTASKALMHAAESYIHKPESGSDDKPMNEDKLFQIEYTVSGTSMQDIIAATSASNAVSAVRTRHMEMLPNLMRKDVVKVKSVYEYIVEPIPEILWMTEEEANKDER